MIELFPESDRIPFVAAEGMDLVAVELSRLENPETEYLEYLDLENQIDENPQSHFRIQVGGYIRKENKSISDTVHPARYLTRVTARKSVSDQALIELDFDREAFEGDTQAGNVVKRPDGLSGGPAFGLGNLELAVDVSHRKHWFSGILLCQADRGQLSTADLLSATEIRKFLQELIRNPVV